MSSGCLGQYDYHRQRDEFVCFDAARDLVVALNAINGESANEQTLALLDELRNIDINNLTPRQALDVLDHLQQLAQQNADQNP